MPKGMYKTGIDKLIAVSVMEVVDKGGHFYKSDVVTAVLGHRNLKNVLESLKDKYQGWDFDIVIKRYIEQRVGYHLQHSKDDHKMRIYESYSAGSGPRRWQPLKTMTARVLRAVIAERKTLAGQINAQVQRYEAILDELTKYGERYTVDEVYDGVMKKVEKEVKAG